MASCLAFASCSIFGSESADLIISKSFRLDLAESVGPVTVVTKDQIETGAYTSLYDVLRSLPGVSVYRQGGDASLSKIRVTGFEDEQVVILINGAVTNDPYWGNQRLEFIDLNQIEQIEMATGNAAIGFAGVSGAVISITTTPKDLKERTFTSVTYGSQNTQSVSTNIQRQAGNKSAIAVSANYIKSDGYDVRADTDPDIDGFEKAGANFSFAHFFDSNQIYFSASQQKGSLKLDMDSTEFNQAQDYVEHQLDSFFLSGTTSWTNKSLEVRHSRSFLSDDNQNPLDNSDFSLIKTSSQSSGLSFSNKASSTITLSLDHSRQEREDQYGWTFVENTGLSGSIARNEPLAIGRPFMVLRHDDNKNWGNHFSGSLGNHFKLHQGDASLSFGSSYRAPNDSESYAATEGERTNQFNADLTLGLNESTTVSARFLKATSLNRISQGAPNYGANIGKNIVNYFSTSLSKALPTYEFILVYDYTDSRLKEHDWKQMPFISENQFRFTYKHFFDQQDITLELFASDGYFTDYNEISGSRQSGFADLNFSHSYSLAPHLKIKTAIENLLDRQVEYNFIYSGNAQKWNSPGRLISLSLAYELQ